VTPLLRNALGVAHLIESDGPGGAERVVAQLASTLQRAGVRNVVFVPANGEGWLASELSGTDVAIERFHLDRPLSPACARSMAAAFGRHQIDIAHSHEFGMAVYGAWASWHAGVPHLITMHGSRYYADRLRRRVAMRAAVAASGGLVAVSHPLADHLSRDLFVPRSRIAVVINGVPRPDAGRMPSRSLRDELSIPADDPLLVSVGNLYPVKGHRHLIEALACLADRHPSVHLAIAGRGDLAEPLLAAARSHGMSGRVHLLGLRPDVGAILAAADVFVLPSMSEGLPLALLEAMFAGCPIVASDVGEVAATLDEGRAGLLVPPGNPSALGDALDRILTDPDRARALGARARQRAADHYDLSQMVRRYRSIYDELLDAPSPAAVPATRSARPNL
jgi:glycosyltransferase involved in cell wall biosynthesis